jgi:hypothetical protein
MSLLFPTLSEISTSRLLCLPPAFTLIPSSAYFFTLKMEAICSSATSVDFQRNTMRYISEDGILRASTFLPITCSHKHLFVLEHVTISLLFLDLLFESVQRQETVVRRVQTGSEARHRASYPVGSILGGKATGARSTHWHLVLKLQIRGTILLFSIRSHGEMLN